MTPDVAASASYLVLIPSYNSGPKLDATIRAALAHWRPVWVVIDGSTDDSAERLERLAVAAPGLRVLRRPHNGGKGAAVLHGLLAAEAAGFQFALVMDADGQHPAECIREFMETSARQPEAMILGVPQFGPEAPASRQWGRLVGNWWTNLETLWGGIHDSLFGFRVYPIRKTVALMQRMRGGRRYDFDTQLAVRLYWEGVRPINIPVPVRYFTPAQGGVSHFHYVRDNALLVWTHAQLVGRMPFHLARFWRWRRSGRARA